MSKPITEPSTEKKMAHLGFRDDQLERRPAPITGLSSAWMERTTNLTLASGTPTQVVSFNAGGATGSMAVDLAGGLIQITETGFYIVETIALYTGSFSGTNYADIRSNAQTQRSAALVAQGAGSFGATGETPGSITLAVVSVLFGSNDEWFTIATQFSGAPQTIDTYYFHAARIADFS